MSAPDLFKLDLPDDDQTSQGEVVPFPSSAAPVAVDEPEPKTSLGQRARPVMERVAAGWRTAWIGDGLLGMRPRPVADLARQFWFAPKPYIRDALILRIPYAIYGAPVIATSAVLHLLLLIVGYPSLLAATGLLVLFLSLFL